MKWRRYFGQNNIPYMLLAVLMSFAMWVMISDTRLLTTSVSAPVQYRNLPREFDISSDLVEEVHLLLRGSSTRLGRLSSGPPPVILDLSTTRTPGERTFTVGAGTLQLPPGVQLERAVPGQIRLRMEHRMRREIPVRVRLQEGSPATGWQGVPEPRTLVIEGPQSRVEAIQFVETDNVDPASADRQGKVRVQAFSGDPQVHFAGNSIITVQLSAAN